MGRFSVVFVLHYGNDLLTTLQKSTKSPNSSQLTAIHEQNRVHKIKRQKRKANNESWRGKFEVLDEGE